MVESHRLLRRSPTAWKFRQWSAPTDKLGRRRLSWMSGKDSEGYDFGTQGPLETDLIIAQFFRGMTFRHNNLTNEGEADMVDVYFDDQAVRSNTYVRAYNDTLIESETLATAQNEQTGSGYAALDYARGTDWTLNGSAVDGGTKTWTATGAWIDITDVALATVASGTAGLMIAYVALGQTRTLANSETLDITPTVTAT